MLCFVMPCTYFPSFFLIEPYFCSSGNVPNFGQWDLRGILLWGLWESFCPPDKQADIGDWLPSFLPSFLRPSLLLPSFCLKYRHNDWSCNHPLATLRESPKLLQKCWPWECLVHEPVSVTDCLPPNFLLYKTNYLLKTCLKKKNQVWLPTS